MIRNSGCYSLSGDVRMDEVWVQMMWIQTECGADGVTEHVCSSD